MWTPHRIKHLRKKLGLTQQEFAELFQAAIDTVQNWEQGRKQPNGPSRVILDLLESHPELFVELEAA